MDRIIGTIAFGTAVALAAIGPAKAGAPLGPGARSHAPPGRSRLPPARRLGGMTDATAGVRRGAGRGDAGDRFSQGRSSYDDAKRVSALPSLGPRAQ
jgi:hypothetical protein